MIARTALAAGLLALGALAAPQTSSAASLTPVPGVAANDSSLVQTVQWRSCRYWRHECAERWGWRTWRYHRCVERHDCR
jgi:hypothetical protein